MLPTAIQAVPVLQENVIGVIVGKPGESYAVDIGSSHLATFVYPFVVLDFQVRQTHRIMPSAVHAQAILSGI